MIELLLGIVLVLVWGALQFIVQPATALIHVALVAGVVLIVRGIVLATGPTTPSASK